MRNIFCKSNSTVEYNNAHFATPIFQVGEINWSENNNLRGMTHMFKRKNNVSNVKILIHDKRKLNKIA